ncbi:hypothetical protein GSY69_03400 [Brevibacterium sp. 5221]|uniref:Uncharacterized protein n=1 Tax=Brevibacterium rongguiense TaxID=2695267 RepID=A0A6N9H5Z8_9MICO|nr:hypothetical protein [Brevibacterium rongguiense]MYM19044.1 hypothetical protein [Brevibacterium rongguiense]
MRPGRPRPPALLLASRAQLSPQAPPYDDEPKLTRSPARASAGQRVCRRRPGAPPLSRRLRVANYRDVFRPMRASLPGWIVSLGAPCAVFRRRSSAGDEPTVSSIERDAK